MIRYQRSRLKINLVLSGSTVKSDTCTKSNTQLGPELNEQIKVVIGQHLKNIGTNLITTLKPKHKAFMTGISDVVKKNPKRFWSYFKLKTKQKIFLKPVNYILLHGKVKCNMFIAHFLSSFSACHDTDAIFPHIDVRHMLNIIINFLMHFFLLKKCLRC